MDLHPHWDTTEPIPAPAAEATRAVPVRARARVPISATGRSRQAAAVIGIALALALGLWQTDGWQAIGQLLPDSLPSPDMSTQDAAPAAVTVRLSDDGAEPAWVTVRAGGNITFQNASQIPYVLEADGVLGAEAGSATVPFVFPGSAETFQLSADQPAGTYTFLSATDTTLQVQVTVVPGTPGLPVPESEEILPATETPPDTAPAPPASIPAADVPLLPQNPYTVGGSAEQPFDPQGNPLPDHFNPDGTLRQSQTLHGGAPRTTAATGPAVWWAIGTSAMAILLRKTIVQRA